MRWLGRATRSRNRGNHEFDARGDFATTASWVHASLRTSVQVGSLWRLIGEVTEFWLRSLTKAADEAGQKPLGVGGWEIFQSGGATRWEHTHTTSGRCAVPLWVRLPRQPEPQEGERATTELLCTGDAFATPSPVHIARAMAIRKDRALFTYAED